MREIVKTASAGRRISFFRKFTTETHPLAPNGMRMVSTKNKGVIVRILRISEEDCHILCKFFACAANLALFRMRKAYTRVNKIRRLQICGGSATEWQTHGNTWKLWWKNSRQAEKAKELSKADTATAAATMDRHSSQVPSKQLSMVKAKLFFCGQMAIVSSLVVKLDGEFGVQDKKKKVLFFPRQWDALLLLVVECHIIWICRLRYRFVDCGKIGRSFAVPSKMWMMTIKLYS